jgi:hypothetical protein
MGAGTFLDTNPRRYLTDQGIYWRNISWISAILFVVVAVVGSFILGEWNELRGNKGDANLFTSKMESLVPNVKTLRYKT